jgi:hypothetical protein
MVDYLDFYSSWKECQVIKSLTPDELPTLIGVKMTDDASHLFEQRLKESK